MRSTNGPDTIELAGLDWDIYEGVKRSSEAVPTRAILANLRRRKQYKTLTMYALRFRVLKLARWGALVREGTKRQGGYVAV